MKHPLICGLAFAFVSLAMVVTLTFHPLRPPSAQVQSRTPLTESDFEIVGGRIYLPAQINGHKISAILDTGASSSVMDLALAEQLNLPSRGELNVQGNGNESVKGKFLSETKVTIGGITEPILYAVPLGSLTAAEGRPLEAIIGSDFFQTHIVEFDYAKRHLRIFDGGADLTPKGTIVPIHFVHNKPHITSELVIGSTTYTMEGMVDTGTSMSALTTRFLNAHPLKVPTTARTIISGGAGGYLEGRYFRPDSVKIGSINFMKPVMELTEATGGTQGPESLFDIQLGADLLRRVRVTFDYPHQRMILEANDELSKPFEADKTGLRIFAQGADLRSYKIIGVLAGSSADQAGIKAADVIESIGGIPASNYTLQQLRDLFKSPGTPKWEIGIRRGDRQLKLTISAKSII